MEIIDVLQRQQDNGLSPSVIDYRLSKNPFVVIRFVFECALKLKAKPWTASIAAHFLHKFIKSTSDKDYDLYLIASTCIYLAAKSDDEPVRLRDVVNVAYNTIHRDIDVLDLSEEYWSFRDAIVQAELLVLRVLEFNTTVELPHKYMLYYLKSLKDWGQPEVWEKTPIIRTCWSFLQDFYHDPTSIDHKPQHVAISIIYLTLQCYGVSVPGTADIEGQTWHEVICKDLKKETMWTILEKVINVYEKEKELLEHCVYKK